MKKFFSLFALAGLLVACQPEELQTVIGDVTGASVTINVTVTDVLTGEEPADTYTVTVSGKDDKGKPYSFSQSGNAFTYTAGDNESIPGFTATVEVTYNGETKPAAKVEVADVLAGSSVSYPVTVVVGKPASEIEYALVEASSEVTDTYDLYLKNSTYATHSHNGGTYYWNDSDYLLTGVVTYPTYSGYNVVSEETSVMGHEGVVGAYAHALGKGSEYNENGGSLDITVSAHCYYTVVCTFTVTTVIYNVTADGDVVGTIRCEQTSTTATYDEVDDGTGHYSHGHGHGDGASNAGGGIIEP